MRDKTHAEHIERQAKMVRDDPKCTWKAEHTLFIDSQIEKANSFYEKLAKTRDGKEKIRKLRDHP